MLKHQCKNTINSSQGNITPPEPSHPTTASHRYSNTAVSQENDLETNFIKIIEVLNEEMSKSLKRKPGKYKQTIGQNE